MKKEKNLERIRGGKERNKEVKKEISIKKYSEKKRWKGKRYRNKEREK